MRWAVLDLVISLGTEDKDDVLRARAEWGQLTGLVHADHELYSERSDAFVEWYMLERCGPDGRTPLERILQAGPAGPITPDDLPAVEALNRTYRSLFRVLNIHEGGVAVDDLLGGGRFEVEERRRLPGVAAGDIFEARLLPDPDRPLCLLFSRTFLFHPREARVGILAHAERARQGGEPRAAVLFRLQRLRLRCTSYRHVPAQRIYAQADGQY